MHPTAIRILKPNFDKHPAEDHLAALISETDATAGSLATEARLVGVSWQTIVGLMLEYGPKFNDVLQALLTALKAKPPVPPAPAPVTP